VPQYKRLSSPGTCDRQGLSHTNKKSKCSFMSQEKWRRKKERRNEQEGEGSLVEGVSLP
jgi:hypothetical protein